MNKHTEGCKLRTFTYEVGSGEEIPECTCDPELTSDFNEIVKREIISRQAHVTFESDWHGNWNGILCNRYAGIVYETGWHNTITEALTDIIQWINQKEMSRD